MAAGPTVVATIKADDQASAAIQKLSAMAHTASEQTAKVTNGVTRDTTAAMERLSALHGAAVSSMSQRLGALASKADKFAAGAFAGFGASFLHEASHIATEMSGLERKMQAFAGLSKEQADSVRRVTDTTFSGSTGGPTGQMELATQLLNNGVKAPQLEGMMQPISLYAMETNQSLGEAATEFAGHMAMLHRVHDDAGREISIGMATPDQAKRAAELTFGALTTFFKEMQGSFKDVMEFSKVAAPSSNMLKVPEHFMFAEEAVLSQQGIRGEVAGTAVAGFNRRLINRTSKSRAAMAEAGLHYADYVEVDPSRITAKGVLDAFMQRAGTASAATKAAVAASVNTFHRDRDLDRFNIALTDDFIGSGNKGLKNRVAASNAAGDITQASIAGVDQLKFLQDVKDKNVGFGLLQPMFREATNAVLLMAQNVDELKRIKGVYDASDNQRTYDAAKREQFDNYAGSQQNFHGAVAGLQDQLFQPLEGPLTHIFNTVADGIRHVAGANSSAKTVLDAVLLGGTAIAGLKTAGTLAEMAGGLMKLATGAEAAGPLVGTLALLADIPFLPAVAGLAALTAGIEAFVHRDELFSAFDKWKHGGTEAPDMPSTPEDAEKLRARLSADRDAIDARRTALDQNLPIDPTLERLQQRLDGLTKLSRIDQMPGVQEALRAHDAAERERPQSDPAVFAARDQLQTLQEQLKRRDAFTSSHIEGLRHYIALHQAEDPNAGDAALDQLKARRSDVRAAMPHGVATSPELDVLNDRILHREQFNRSQLEERLRAALRLIEQDKDAGGAPKVSATDVDAAKARLDAARVEAQQRHDSELEKAKADLAKARLDAEAIVRQTPATREAQAQVDARRDELRATAARDSGADTKIRDLQADMRRNEAALTAYERFRPTFTRMGVDGLPTTLPDFSKASVPRTGPAFGFEGPVVPLPDYMRHLAPPVATETDRLPVRPAPAFLDPQYAPAAFRPNAPAAPAAPTKVDVGVTGTVQGMAELHNNVAVQLQPSPYFTALVAHAESISSMSMSGMLGHDMLGDHMSGNNAAVRVFPARVGIGHN